MEQLLSANVAINLYWFGRHLERVETTLNDVIALFDPIIDTDKEAGKRYFANLGVTLSYSGASEFLNESIFGDHSANLGIVMGYARENAVICRSQIDTDAFGEVIKLNELFESAMKSTHPIDYRFFDTALSLINEIWGALSCGMERRLSDHFIQLGKLVEKSDLNLRHGEAKKTTLSYMKEIAYTARLLASDVEIAIDESDLQGNMPTINGVIDRIVVE